MDGLFLFPTVYIGGYACFVYNSLTGLRILKYDRNTEQPLANVTFEIYRDGELFDTKTTNAEGQIVLTNLQPGTYLVKEVDTDNTGGKQS